MGLMSDNEIKEAVKKGEIIIKEFDEHQINPASYDARLGKQIFKTKKEEGLIDSSKKGIIIIEIGEFVLLSTCENFTLPNNIAGQIGLRSHYARKGLILLSGPQIDPGFRGILTLGVYNVGPKIVAIPFLEPFCTIEFHKLNVPATEPYEGEYQNQTTIPTKDIEYFMGARGATLAEVVETMGNLSNSINTLESTVKGIKRSLWVIPVIIVVVMTLFGLFQPLWLKYFLG